jgi:ribosomal protein S6
MEKKAFARVADKRHSTGFYANVIFDATPAAIAQLHKKFSLNEEVFRVLFTLAPAPKAAK